MAHPSIESGRTEASRPLRHPLRGLMDVFFPARCSVCGAPCGPGVGFACEACLPKLERSRLKRACPRCAVSVAPYEVHKGRCKTCRHLQLFTLGIVRVAGYTTPWGAVFRAYKYRGREDLGVQLGARLSKVVAAASWVDRIEALTAVPSHWTHRIQRPVDPAHGLTGSVAKTFGWPQVSLLRRVRGGPHQIGLDFDQRKANVRGAFALRRGVELSGARLLLIDDVRTTGATINECAKVLKKGGAAEVYAAVVVQAGWNAATGKVASPI